jgi:tRNA threonylcarbamoyladenosine biosynthesis protein TsaE
MPVLHEPILGTRTLHWPDESHCAAFAAALAERPALRNAFIELHGPLGAGKTTFVRHLLRALGVRGHVKSPSYTVLEPHQAGPLSISHFDFYRFDDPHEWVDAGFRDLFAAPGLKLAEWPDKAAGQLPEPDLRILIDPQADGSRTVRLDPRTDRGRSLLP